MCQGMHSTGTLQLSPALVMLRLKLSVEKLIGLRQVFEFTSEDLLDMGEIGRGAFGTVNKMVHKRTNTVMAVKRIRSTVDEKDQKQLLMDLAVVMKTKCPNIVQFYGALFKEVCVSNCRV
jgi:mitogen-activated protein kinase kinase 4